MEQVEKEESLPLGACHASEIPQRVNGSARCAELRTLPQGPRLLFVQNAFTRSDEKSCATHFLDRLSKDTFFLYLEP